jgi:hypothetical protein
VKEDALMKTLKRDVAVAVACLFVSGTALAWQEGVIVDFGGQSYEGWSGIVQPATAGSQPQAGEPGCRPMGATGKCESAAPALSGAAVPERADCADTGVCPRDRDARETPSAAARLPY